MSKNPYGRKEKSVLRRVELDIHANTWTWATAEAAKHRMGQREFMQRFLNLAALALEEQDDAGQEG